MLDNVYLYLTYNQFNVLKRGISLAMRISSTPISFTNSVEDIVNFAYVDKNVALHPYWKKYAKEFDKELKKNALKDNGFPKNYFNTYEKCGEWWLYQLMFKAEKTGTKDKSGRYQYIINISNGDPELLTEEIKLKMFPCLLELVVRLSLGQIENMWEVFNGIIDEDTGKPISDLYCMMSRDAEQYRDKIFTIFPYSGSLGIGSEKLTDDVKVLYELYKVYLYQYNCYGVNETRPLKLSYKENCLPEFGFEEQFVCEYTSDIKKLEKAYKESINDDYRILRHPIVDDGTLFFPIDKNYSVFYQKIEPSQKLFRKVNGYYNIR